MNVLTKIHIINLHHAGYHAKHIASVVGLSVTYVRKILRDEGLVKPIFTEDTIQKMMQMWNADAPVKDIAKALGLKSNSLAARISQLRKIGYGFKSRYVNK